MKKTIPIFPLDLVLFPRQELPLRIFEPRYKQLVEDCMLGDGQFGVCLIDHARFVNDWNAPRLTGTIAKIMGCKDVELGQQLHIDTVGRNTFRIKEIIEPAMPQMPDHDPSSSRGRAEISKLHEKIVTGKKMYIQARVEMIPEIDQSISLVQWEGLVRLWKAKIVRQAQPNGVEPQALDQMLRQYYLATDTPTTDFVYSLAALGAGDPNELQPLLEATDMDELIKRAEELLA